MLPLLAACLVAPWAAKGAWGCLEIMEMGLCQVVCSSPGSGAPLARPLPAARSDIPAHQSPLLLPQLPCWCNQKQHLFASAEFCFILSVGPGEQHTGPWAAPQTVPQGGVPWPQWGTQVCKDSSQLWWAGQAGQQHHWELAKVSLPCHKVLS